MRREDQYLRDILDAADAIERFVRGVRRERFLEDDLLQSAVIQKLIVIGEAVAHLSEGFLRAHRDVQWADVVGFRNVAVHGYFALDWEIVWDTATRNVPELRRDVARIWGALPGH